MINYPSGGIGRQQQQLAYPKQVSKKQAVQASQHKPKSLSRGNVYFRRNLSYFSVFVKIHSQLYEKYSSSQNYYYTREVNEILYKQEGTASLIRFRDQETYDDEEELFFQEYYVFAVYPGKIAYLTEYYKFHSDMARLFMEPLNHIVNYYYEKQRKIKYAKITKMLAAQQQDQQKSKNDSEISPSQERNQLNEDMNDNRKDEDDKDQGQQPSMERLLAPLESFLRKSQKQIQHGEQQQNRNQMNNKQNKQQNIIDSSLMNESIRTLNDLKMKLADIVGGNSQIFNDRRSSGGYNNMNDGSSIMLSSFQSIRSGQIKDQQHSIGNLSRFLQFQEQQQQQMALKDMNWKKDSEQQEGHLKTQNQSLLTRQMIQNVMMNKPTKRVGTQQLQIELPLQPQQPTKQLQLCTASELLKYQQPQQQLKQQQQQHSIAGTHGSLSIISGIPSHHPSVSSLYTIPTTKHSSQQDNNGKIRTNSRHGSSPRQEVINNNHTGNACCLSARGSNQIIYYENECQQQNQNLVKGSTDLKNNLKQSEVLNFKKVSSGSSQNSRSNSVHKAHQTTSNQQAQQQQQIAQQQPPVPQISQLVSQYPNSFQAYKQHQQKQLQIQLNNLQTQQEDEQQLQGSQDIIMNNEQYAQQQQPAGGSMVKSYQAYQRQQPIGIDGTTYESQCQQYFSKNTQQQHLPSSSSSLAITLPRNAGTITMPSSATCPSSPLEKDIFKKLFGPTQQKQQPQKEALGQTNSKAAHKKHAESVHVNLAKKNNNNQEKEQYDTSNQQPQPQPSYARLATQTPYHSRQSNSQQFNNIGMVQQQEVAPSQLQQQFQNQQLQQQTSLDSQQQQTLLLLQSLQQQHQQQQQKQPLQQGNTQQQQSQLPRQSQPNLSAQQHQSSLKSQPSRREGYVSNRGVLLSDELYAPQFGKSNDGQEQIKEISKGCYTSNSTAGNAFNSINQVIIQSQLLHNTPNRQNYMPNKEDGGGDHIQFAVESTQVIPNNNSQVRNKPQQLLDLQQLQRQTHQQQAILLAQTHGLGQTQQQYQYTQGAAATQPNEQQLSQAKITKQTNNPSKGKGYSTARTTSEEERILASKLSLNIQLHHSNLLSNNNNIEQIHPSLTQSSYNPIEERRKAETLRPNSQTSSMMNAAPSNNNNNNNLKQAYPKPQTTSTSSTSRQHSARVEIPKLQLNAEMLLQQASKSSSGFNSNSSTFIGNQRKSNPSIQTEVFEGKQRQESQQQLWDQIMEQQVSTTRQLATEYDQHNKQYLINGQQQNSKNNQPSSSTKPSNSNKSIANNKNSNSNSIPSTNGFMTDRTHYSEKIARKQMNVSKHMQSALQTARETSQNQQKSNSSYKPKTISHSKTRSEALMTGQNAWNTAKLQQQKQLNQQVQQAPQFASYNGSRQNSVHQIATLPAAQQPSATTWGSSKSNLPQQSAQYSQTYQSNMPTQPNAQDSKEIYFNRIGSNSPPQQRQQQQQYPPQPQMSSGVGQYLSTLKTNPMVNMINPNSLGNSLKQNGIATNNINNNNSSSLKSNRIPSTTAAAITTQQLPSTSGLGFSYHNGNTLSTFPYNYNSSQLLSNAAQQQMNKQQQQQQSLGNQQHLQQQQPQQLKYKQQQQPLADNSAYYQSNQAATVRVSLKQNTPPPLAEDYTRATLLTQPSQDNMRAMMCLSQPSSDTMRLTLTQPSQDHILSPLLSHLQQSSNFKQF